MKPKLSPAARMRFLDSPEGIKIVPTQIRKQQSRELKKLRFTLYAELPSHSWADAVWQRSEATPEGWVVCTACGRRTPPIHITSSGTCWDCVDTGVDCRSPSAVALIYIEENRINYRD